MRTLHCRYPSVLWSVRPHRRRLEDTLFKRQPLCQHDPKVLLQDPVAPVLPPHSICGGVPTRPGARVTRLFDADELNLLQLHFSELPNTSSSNSSATLISPRVSLVSPRRNRRDSVANVRRRAGSSAFAPAPAPVRGQSESDAVYLEPIEVAPHFNV